MDNKYKNWTNPNLLRKTKEKIQKTNIPSTSHGVTYREPMEEIFSCVPLTGSVPTVEIKNCPAILANTDPNSKNDVRDPNLKEKHDEKRARPPPIVIVDK
ncbi:hypothetical protein JTB14_019582 [Gonioctena quinquepunctata]|nr:hypothetical protein JTB14_019582 [Gonioctena quinquepunctata]